MALLIFLKQPNRAIAVESNKKNIIKELGIRFNKHSTFIFKTIEGNSILVPKDSIAYVQEISKEKLIKQKKDFDQKQKQQQKGSNLLVPNMTFPKNRN
jgi:hypothetical protein